MYIGKCTIIVYKKGSFVQLHRGTGLKCKYLLADLNIFITTSLCRFLLLKVIDTQVPTLLGIVGQHDIVPNNKQNLKNYKFVLFLLFILTVIYLEAYLINYSI